jgi:hypothetical protein
MKTELNFQQETAINFLALLRLLMSKGLITRDEWLEFRKEAEEEYRRVPK